MTSTASFAHLSLSCFHAMRVSRPRLPGWQHLDTCKDQATSCCLSCQTPEDLANRAPSRLLGYVHKISPPQCNSHLGPFGRRPGPCAWGVYPMRMISCPDSQFSASLMARHLHAQILIPRNNVSKIEMHKYMKELTHASLRCLKLLDRFRRNRWRHRLQNVVAVDSINTFTSCKIMYAGFRRAFAIYENKRAGARAVSFFEHLLPVLRLRLSVFPRIQCFGWRR